MNLLSTHLRVPLVLPVLAACGGSSSDGGETGDDGTTTVDTDGPGATGPGETGPGTVDGGPGTGTGTGSDTSDTSDTSEDETTAGPTVSCDDLPVRGEACQPAGKATFDWAMRIDERPFADQDLEATCTLTDLADDGSTSTLTLDCMRFTFEIDVTTDPHQTLSLLTGATLDLRAWSYFEDEAVIARWLTLRQDGLSLALFDASEFAPPAGFDFAPLTIDVLPTDCPALGSGECDCFEGGECRVQDAALQVAFEDQTVTVFEGNTTSVGRLTSYQITAGTMQRLHCMSDDCGYNYATWFVRGMILGVPEG